MSDHHLHDFESAACFEIVGNAHRSESVAPNLDAHADFGRAALDDAVGIDPVYALAIHHSRGIKGRAEEGAPTIINDVMHTL
jgi:hypothetical protein